MAKHPNDMTREELRDLVSAMSWSALDLAQHLSFTNEWLKQEFREEAYKRGERMAYELSHMPYAESRPEGNPTCNVVMFGETGLTRL